MAVILVRDVSDVWRSSASLKQREGTEKHAFVRKVPFRSRRSLPVSSGQCPIRESCFRMLHLGCCPEYSMKCVATHFAFTFPVCVFLLGLYCLLYRDFLVEQPFKSAQIYAADNH